MLGDRDQRLEEPRRETEQNEWCGEVGRAQAGQADKARVVKRVAALLFAGFVGFAGAAHALDSDRVDGTGKEVKGNIEEKSGQVLGDNTLAQQGQSDHAAGQAQDAWGKFKDAVRDLGASIESKFSGK